MIALGNTNINRICIGATDVSKIYIGDTLVFGGEPVLDYLTFTAQEAGSTIAANLNHSTSIEYSYDGSTWSDANEVTITLSNIGDKVYYRGVARNNGSSFNATFEMTGKIAASGSIMSLYNNNPADLTISVSNAFAYLFRDCTSLTSAPILPATTLSMSCYYSLFNGCSGLIKAPELPATTLDESCYGYMFVGCTSLTTPPSVLPATTLANYCYEYMFYNCVSLNTAPIISAITLATRCCRYMFGVCRSLTTAPSLPSTTLANYCYENMFYSCSSLTTAPVLAATTMKIGCYYSMFQGCTALETAPELPATTLADSCYGQMFYDCSSLTTAPSVLPSTSTTTSCYQSMFQNCSSLTTSPDILTENLTILSFKDMFYRCSRLSDVTIHITGTRWNTSYTNSWLSGTASTGVLHNLGNCTNIPADSGSGVPSGWYMKNTKVPADEIWYTSTDSNIVTPYNEEFGGATILSNTYSGGKGVIKFDIPIDSVGVQAFKGCETLLTIQLPNIITLNESAFEDCTELISVYLGQSVESIDINIFNNCKDLDVIIYNGNVPVIASDTFAGVTNLSIKVPSVKVVDYQSAENWENYAAYITAI